MEIAKPREESENPPSYSVVSRNSKASLRCIVLQNNATNRFQVLPPTVELLDYFRERVAEFEKLEEDYIARIEALNDSAPGLCKFQFPYRFELF